MSSRAQTLSGQSSGSSHRDVQSGSSTTSGRSERGSRQPKVHDSIESAVTRLLVSIKELLESLTQWSEMKVSEEGVSDVYVRLGNDFNAAVHAFSLFNIDMSELMSVPDDLRIVLEQCLAEDATPENLDLYLPNVRHIITSLLQGLRLKQGIYRKIHRDNDHERTDSRSSRTSSSRREGSHRPSGSRSQNVESDEPNGSRRKKRETPVSRPGTNGSSEFIGGFIPSLVEQPTGQSEELVTHSESQRRSEKPTPASQSNQASTFSTPPSESREIHTSSRSATPAYEEPPPPPASPPPVPPGVKRYSLVDKPRDKPVGTTPSVHVRPSSPLNGQDMIDSPLSETSPPQLSDPPAAVAKSLAALKSTDVLLERRASKRFSSYNISKMTSGPMHRERSLRNVTQHSNRKSLIANNNNLTPNELAVLTEVDDEDGIQINGTQPSSPERNGHSPIPAVSKSPLKPPEPAAAQDRQQQPRTMSSKITVFLQLGREVKKVSVEPGFSFSALRVLFVDKFSYNPGLENFPAIYIRDPSSQVQYELEDTDEVKENCLLSLNIEPLDQIKQHIDTQIGNLANDLKDLKTAMVSRGQQPLPPLIDLSSTSAMVESTPLSRPSEKQFQTIARRLSRFIGDGTSPFIASTSQPLPTSPLISLQAQMTGQSLQSQMTGASVVSEYTNRVVNDLKTQFDEVQNLRRDLGVMRQLYTEFMKSTKESLSNLRTQTQSVKQLANSSIGGARQYIDTGKKTLDSRTQNALTEVEKLQDIIESVKDDVIKRQITPNAMFFKSIKKDMDSVGTELVNLSEHIKAVKPMWKKTWEEELQNIVEEQQFLTHQEEFLDDLMEDHKAMVEVHGHVEKVISLRRPAGKRGKGFKPRLQEDNPDGLTSVMLEIRGAQIDSDKRMQAIEANKKNRLKELAVGSTHELHDELYDFVGQKKLKMTGGADEVERVRQKKSEATLKAMFSGTIS